jgi:23S rRNA (uracil1939-C5)-methyltransferase
MRRPRSDAENGHSARVMLGQCASIVCMSSIETPAAAPRTRVLGRALVRVFDLDRNGEAQAVIAEWLLTPAPAAWAVVYGPRADDVPLPDRCSFVGGLPGELIEVELDWPTPRPGRKRSRHVPSPHVTVSAVHEPSPDRVAASCQVFGNCGGCQLQHMAYGRQLDWKTQRVARLFAEAGLGNVDVRPAIGCAVPWHYRNHMRFSVARSGRIGLTARGSHHVIPLSECPIADQTINKVLGVLADTQARRPQVLIRQGVATGQTLVQPAPDEDTAQRLASAGIALRTDYLEERLHATIGAAEEGASGEVAYRIRPSSFFQTNTAQANVMASLVLAALPLGPRTCIVDAYCGVGTFAALISPHAGTVLAVEESASAIADARHNLGHLANVRIIQAKTELWLPQASERIDGLVIDPPRAGCMPTVLQALVERRVPRVVYVSCAPDTLARDLAYLCNQAGAYRVLSAQPLDMFPHTAHIETVVALEAS